MMLLCHLLVELVQESVEARSVLLVFVFCLSQLVRGPAAHHGAESELGDENADKSHTILVELNTG